MSEGLIGAAKIVQFEVDPGDTEAQWLAVDDKGVPLVNHKGSVDVDASLPKHTLTWWFTGNSGTKIRHQGNGRGQARPCDRCHKLNSRWGTRRRRAAQVHGVAIKQYAT